MKPIASARHEAQESSTLERTEHRTGREGAEKYQKKAPRKALSRKVSKH